jgi:hypothetical protein
MDSLEEPDRRCRQDQVLLVLRIYRDSVAMGTLVRFEGLSSHQALSAPKC